MLQSGHSWVRDWVFFLVIDRSDLKGVCRFTIMSVIMVSFTECRLLNLEVEGNSVTSSLRLSKINAYKNPEVTE